MICNKPFTMYHYTQGVFVPSLGSVSCMDRRMLQVLMCWVGVVLGFSSWEDGGKEGVFTVGAWPGAVSVCAEKDVDAS